MSAAAVPGDPLAGLRERAEAHGYLLREAFDGTVTVVEFGGDRTEGLTVAEVARWFDGSERTYFAVRSEADRCCADWFAEFGGPDPGGSGPEVDR